MDIPAHLIEQISRGNCFLFVGSGLSQCAGLPDWPNILRCMLDRLGEHEALLTDKQRRELEAYIDDRELLLVANEMSERLGNRDLRRFIGQTFDRPNLELTDIHKLLPEIPFAAALTTNYDTLLESAYASQSPRILTYSDCAELSATHSKGFYILKVNGTIDDEEAVVFAWRNFRRSMDDNPEYRKCMENLFSTKSALFLGFSVTDPDLVLFLDEFAVTLRTQSQKHYALMKTTDVLSVAQREFKRDYKIQIIPYRDISEVQGFLIQITERLNMISSEASVYRKQLPVQLLPTTVLEPIGREEEATQISQALVQHKSLVITGLPGVGKTTVLALAIRQLNKMDHDFNEMCFHRIVETGSEEEHLNRLLRALITILDPYAQIESDSMELLYSQVRKLMSDRNVLFAIDNADDTESQSAIQKILARLPQLTLAVTSRQQDWQNIAVRSLPGLSDEEGLKLFVETYKKKISKRDEQEITSFCQQVDGHPMVITHFALEANEDELPIRELVANRGSLDIIDIGRELTHRFDSVRERLPGKCHQILSVIGLLETAALRTDLVREVTQASIEELELMEEKYLIRCNPGRKHFTVHELVRTWCRSRLNNLDAKEEKQAEHLCDQCAKFYIQFLRYRQQCNPDELAEIDDEWPNILGLTDKLSDPELTLSLVDEAIGDNFDDPQGYIPRRRQMASLIRQPDLQSPRSERLLDLARKADGTLAARIEKNLGHFHYWVGDYRKAESLFYSAQQRYRNHEDKEGEVATTWLLGYLADDENCYREAESLYREGTELADQVKPYKPELVATGLHLIGCTLYHQGKFREAEMEFSRAYELIAGEDVPDLRARINRRLGVLAIEFRQLDDAEKILVSVAELVEQINRPRDSARISRQLGRLYLRRCGGDLEKAEEVLQQALKGFEDLGARRGIGYTHHDLAILRRMQGRLEEAKKLCMRSLKIAEETGSLYGQARAYEELANILEAKSASPEDVNRKRYRACNIYKVIRHQRASILLEQLKKADALKPRIPEGVRGIIFDLMDTLAHLEPGIYEETHRKSAHALGVSPERLKWAWTNSRKRASIGSFRSTKARIEWVARQLDVTLSDEQLSRIVEEEETMWQKKIQLDKDAISLLEHLRDLGYGLAIVSNGPVAMRDMGKSLGIGHLVDTFVSSLEVGTLKPEPMIYRRTLERLGLEASECVFIGDGDDHELDGAREMGMYAIRINRPRPPYTNIKEESLDWDFEVNGLEELTPLFQQEPLHR